MISIQVLRCSSRQLVRHFSSSSHRCRAKLIDGKAIANQIKDEVKAEIDKWITAGHRRPHLTAILVGEDPASSVYVRNKITAANYTGITSKTIHLSDSVTEAELLERIQALNHDNSVDGILVQLPLPWRISERRVCDTVVPWKDVDGFSVINVGRFCCDTTAMLPATPAGVVELIRRSEIPTFGKNAVVCGRSKNVGMPIAMLLHSDGNNSPTSCDMTTTICHRNTPHEQLAKFTRSADILVVATGIPGLITVDMIKEGAAVIDVGINQVIDPVSGKRKLVGDVDFKEVVEKAGYITPVPGGVGPMTVAMLMKNTLLAATNAVNYDDMIQVGPSPYNTQAHDVADLKHSVSQKSVTARQADVRRPQEKYYPNGVDDTSSIDERSIVVKVGTCE